MLLDRSIFPPLLCKKLYIPSSRVLTLFTTAVDLVPAIPGKIIVPEKCFVIKELGTAYNINGASTIFAWDGVTTWSTLTPASFIDSVNITFALIVRPIVAGTANVIVQVPTILGRALTVSNTVANFTVGTGGLTFWITFRIFDIANLGWL